MSYPPSSSPPGEPNPPTGSPSSGPPAFPPTTPFPQGQPYQPGQPSQQMPEYRPGTATPSYAQPGYGQPQPGHAQPSYAQPEYAQPEYAQPGYAPASPGTPGRTGGSTTVLWVLITVFAVLLCGGAGVAGMIVYRNSEKTVDAQPGTPATQGAPSRAPTNAPTAPPSKNGPRTITYQVTGDGPASISYIKDSKAGSQRLSSAALPWRIEASAPENLFVVSLIAMRKGNDEGTITCRVLVDGKEVISKTRTGPFAMVTCLKVVAD